MEINEERAVFIANEIGAAVIELIANGMDVNRPNITDHLELKRKSVGNMRQKKNRLDGRVELFDQS